MLVLVLVFVRGDITLLFYASARSERAPAASQHSTRWRDWAGDGGGYLSTVHIYCTYLL